MKIQELAKILDFPYEGENFDILALNSLENASSDELSYCDNEANVKFLKNTKAKVVLVKADFIKEVPKHSLAWEVENPHLAFAILSENFKKPLFQQKQKNFIHESVYIMGNVYLGSNVKIAENTKIMHGAYIGDNVEIGQNCIIYPNVVLYNDTKIGNNCLIHANSVIGSDGFGYAHRKDGSHVKIHHNGNVVIEDDVEIGACTTIDRGVFASTLIKKNTKIDNLVQIGHNCELGNSCLMVSQVGLAGSTKFGRNVVMGGQAGSGGHVEVGDFAQIAARGGVSKNLAGHKNYAGHPIMELKDWYKLQAKIIRFFKKA